MKKGLLGIVACFVILVTLISINTNVLSVFAGSNYDISAKSYVVLDKNGKVLIEKNMNVKREVASICKLMTTLLTLEEIDKGNIDLNDVFLASDYACAVEGSQAFLDSQQEYSVKDLLKSVIVASANDSAIVLAENIAGSESEFVKLMNNKAIELGMHNTLYINATGLSENGKEQYSTCLDTAIILNNVSDYSLYQEFSQIWMDKLIHPSGRETELVNTNRLIKYYPYCKTGKTGFTDDAGYCLSSTAVKDNLKLTCVVLGASSSANRFSDSVALYSSAYGNFVSEKIIEKDVLVNNKIIVQNGKSDKIDIVYADDFDLTLNKHNKEQYELIFVLKDTISAPVNVGDKLGEVKVIIDDNEVGCVDLVSNTQIEKQNFKDIVNKIIDNLSLVK